MYGFSQVKTCTASTAVVPFNETETHTAYVPLQRGVHTLLLDSCAQDP